MAWQKVNIPLLLLSKSKLKYLERLLSNNKLRPKVNQGDIKQIIDLKGENLNKEHPQDKISIKSFLQENVQDQEKEDSLETLKKNLQDPPTMKTSQIMHVRNRVREQKYQQQIQRSSLR